MYPQDTDVENIYPDDEEFVYHQDTDVENDEIVYPEDNDEEFVEDIIDGNQYNLMDWCYSLEENEEMPLLDGTQKENNEVKIDDYVVDGIIVCDIGEELLTEESRRDDYISDDEELYFRPMCEPIDDEAEILDRMERGEYFDDEIGDVSDVLSTSDTYIKNLENENVTRSSWRVERARQENYSTTNTYTRFKYTKLDKVDSWQTSTHSIKIGQPPAIIRIAQAFRTWVEIMTAEPTMCNPGTCCISYMV